MSNDLFVFVYLIFCATIGWLIGLAVGNILFGA